jgi:hypothetical protein
MAHDARRHFLVLKTLKSKLVTNRDTLKQHLKADRNRLRMSALIPDLRLRYAYSIDDDEGMAIRHQQPSDIYSQRTHSQSGFGQRIDVQLSWRIGEFLSHPDELRYRRLDIQNDADKNQEFESLTDAYQDFLRARTELKVSSSIAERYAARQAMMDATLELDRLTAGAFSELWAQGGAL